MAPQEFYDPNVRALVPVDTVTHNTVNVRITRNAAGETSKIVETYPAGGSLTTNFVYETEA